MIDRKGTEKPIEIFIALFIILAVAMLLLRMFKDQLDEKMTDMRMREWEEERERLQEAAKRTCDKACTAAVANKCSKKSLAEFCTTRVAGGLDLNLNQDKSEYIAFNETNGLLLSGGTCEDHIYCREIVDCNVCEVTLDFETCVQVLCEWLRETEDVPTSTRRARSAFRFGTCLSPAAKNLAMANRETWDWNLDAHLTTYCT